jgi:hypothetical protein
MKVLYRDEFEQLAVMEVTKASYDADEELLNLNGSEDDFAVRVTAAQASAVVAELYEKDKADVTAYPYVEYDFDDFDEDDDEDEYDEDEFDAMLNRILDGSDKEGVLRFK